MAKQIAGVIFDIDGCLIRGETAIAGAPEVVRELRRRGVRIAYFTNGNMETLDQWIDRLAGLGFDANRHEIITSVVIAAEYVRARFPTATVLPVGTQALAEILSERNLRLVDWDRADEADVVVMGRDPDFDQRRLRIVCRAIWGGARFIATNLDRRLPVEDCFIPETGPMVKAVAWATGKNPLVVGKPSARAGRVALKLLGLPCDRSLVVGDNVCQDVKMGKLSGMQTALVMSGCTGEEDIARIPRRLKPDVILPDVTHLLRWLDA